MPVDSSEQLLPVKRYTLTEEDRIRFASESDLGMVGPGNSILNEIAQVVEPSDVPLVMDVVEAMKTAARGQRQSRGKKRRRTLVGLAAPQIGVGLRIILVDTHVGSDRKNYGALRCFINPEIVWHSHETEEGREGCFSAGPVWGLVRRPIAIKVRALTQDGKPLEQIFEGFTARILQHEIDHLNGIRFPDRIRSDRKRHWVHAEEIEAYTQQINHWARICSLARWQTVKNGTYAKEKS
jgi:peptide deformylase